MRRKMKEGNPIAEKELKSKRVTQRNRMEIHSEARNLQLWNAIGVPRGQQNTILPESIRGNYQPLNQAKKCNFCSL